MIWPSMIASDARARIFSRSCLLRLPIRESIEEETLVYYLILVCNSCLKVLDAEMQTSESSKQAQVQR